jgi:hypothetical protein
VGIKNLGGLTDLTNLISDYDRDHNNIVIYVKSKLMNLQDFESHYREAMNEALNELQTAVLLLAQVQRKIHEIGSSMQNMNESVEEFINQEKTE